MICEWSEEMHAVAWDTDREMRGDKRTSWCMADWLQGVIIATCIPALNVQGENWSKQPGQSIMLLGQYSLLCSGFVGHSILKL